MSGYGGSAPGGDQVGPGPYSDPYAPQSADPYGQSGPAQSPYGQDPYAQNSYGQDPYGQHPYGPDPYQQGGYVQGAFGPGGYPAGPPGYGAMGAGYGPPGLGYAPAKTGAAIAALICNILLSISCYGLLAAPGIITAAIAISRAQTDPRSARKLTAWSWGIFGVGIVIAILLVIGVVVYTSNADSGTPFYGV